MNFKSAKAFHEYYTSRLLNLGYEGVTVRPQTNEYHKKIVLRGEGKTESFIHLKDDSLAATVPSGGFATGNKKNSMAILHYLTAYAKFKGASEIRLREIGNKNGWHSLFRHWDSKDSTKLSDYISALGFKRQNPEVETEDLILPSLVMIDSFDILEKVYLHLSNATKEDPTFTFRESEVSHKRSDSFFSFHIKHLGLAIQFHIITTEGKYYLIKNDDLSFEFTKENFSAQFDDLIKEEHASNQLKILINPPIDNLLKLLVHKSRSQTPDIRGVADTIMQQFIDKDFTFDEVEKESARILKDNLNKEIFIFSAPFTHGTFCFFGQYYVAYSYDHQLKKASMLFTENTGDIHTYYLKQFEDSLKEILVFD